jgi:Family of unknown function (DUF5522)
VSAEEENQSKKEPELFQNGDYYLTEEGYRVFTEKFHLRRGYCCENGCRHCPYGFNDKKKKGNKWRE